jgi:hypothetical protein
LGSIVELHNEIQLPEAEKPTKTILRLLNLNIARRSTLLLIDSYSLFVDMTSSEGSSVVDHSGEPRLITPFRGSRSILSS